MLQENGEESSGVKSRALAVEGQASFDKKRPTSSSDLVGGEKKSEPIFFEPLLLLGIVVLNVIAVFDFFSFPFSFVFSAPVVPVIAQVVEFFSVEADVAVRLVLLGFYILGPVTLYLLVKEVSGRRMAAVMAAVLYSLPIFKIRFEALTVLGDGAHVAALTLMPLAAFWLLRFLKRGSYKYSLLSALMVVLVGLTSPFGLFVLVGILVIITFSEMLLGLGRVRFVRFSWVILISVGLSAFWYNPSFVQLSLDSASGQAVVGAVKNLIPISLFVFPVLGAFGLLVFDKRPQLQPLFIALGLTVAFWLISFAGGLVQFAVGARSRYFPELMLSISFLWGVVGAFLYDLVKVIPKSKWFPVPKSKRLLMQKVMVLLFAVFVLGSIILSPFAKFSSSRNRRSDPGADDSAVIDISSMRELTGGMARIVGYSISGVSLLVIIGMRSWLGTQEKKV